MRRKKIRDATSVDFMELDLFRFLDKREHSPDEVFRVKRAGNGWTSCRRPMPNAPCEQGEYRYSFSDDYFKGATIEKMGKGVAPPPPPSYARPRELKEKLKRVVTLGPNWTPPKRTRRRKEKAQDEQFERTHTGPEE